MNELKISVERNQIGQKLTIEVQTRYEDLMAIELPKNCYQCPVGYMEHNCGRNVPFKKEDGETRPTTCKLVEVEHMFTPEFCIFFGRKYREIFKQTHQDEQPIGEGADGGDDCNPSCVAETAREVGTEEVSNTKDVG